MSLQVERAETGANLMTGNVGRLVRVYWHWAWVGHREHDHLFLLRTKSS